MLSCCASADCFLVGAAEEGCVCAVPNIKVTLNSFLWECWCSGGLSVSSDCSASPWLAAWWLRGCFRKDPKGLSWCKVFGQGLRGAGEPRTEPDDCGLLRTQWEKHTVNFAIITCYPAPRCSVCRLAAHTGLQAGERQLLELGRCREA